MLIVLSDQHLYTLPVALATFATGQYQADHGMLMAGSVILVDGLAYGAMTEVVLKDMDRAWQKRFLTWGILIAVFVISHETSNTSSDPSGATNVTS